MYKLYRGDPLNGGTLIGIYHDAKLAAKAMEESAARHKPGTAYYMIRENEGPKSAEPKTD